jgi:hypothetical protein
VEIARDKVPISSNAMMVTLQTEMVALLLVRLNHFGNAQPLKVLFQVAKRFVEMENLKVHIQKFVTMTMKLMVMDVRQLAKLKQTGNALELKELQAHASL